MTTTYDPTHPQYLVEQDVREELTRVFDLCHGCRLCFNLCPSFPSLFRFVDDHDGAVEAMSHAEQDQVVDECYQCKLCYVKCPYVPPHEWDLDFPRLMMRARAERHHRVSRRVTERMTDQVLGHTDAIGKISTKVPKLVNAVAQSPGSIARRVMQATTGVHADRLLPPYAKQRFSTWFKRRRPKVSGAARAQISVFPTCFIEYMAPPIGKSLVAIAEHNDIACSIPDGTRCCGAPWLHEGDIKRFEQVARRNVEALAKEVREGKEVLVAQPTCAYVIKKDYPVYAAGVDADLVSQHTFDAAEYFVNEHRRKGGGLKTDFVGEVPEEITYHFSCHLRAQNIGARSRELLALAGSRVQVVERCSGIDGTWGYREENYSMAKKVIAPLVREIERQASSVVCGDCHLANTAITEETGIEVRHPLQIFARAYGKDDGE